MKYTGSRYGDVRHKEEIDASTIVDFDVTWSRDLSAIGMKKMNVSLTVNNVFDEEYISIINTSDYQTLGSTYQAGAPLTVYASVSFSL